jgi:hypothetical protein
LKYTTDLVGTNTEIAMGHNEKIVEKNLCNGMESFALIRIYKKNTPIQYPDDGNNFTKDIRTRIVIIHAKRN